MSDSQSLLKPKARKLGAQEQRQLSRWIAVNYTQEKVTNEKLTLVAVAKAATFALGFEVSESTVNQDFKFLGIKTRADKEIPEGQSRAELAARVSDLEKDMGKVWKTLEYLQKRVDG